mmetsp:Transcript_13202/g.52673  ORF Transcript_13202/g.52673 Transcript_13202/m.52673 type:complete len:310 (+) Transcript_13202:456-1385(+)
MDCYLLPITRRLDGVGRLQAREKLGAVLGRVPVVAHHVLPALMLLQVLLWIDGLEHAEDRVAVLVQHDTKPLTDHVAVLEFSPVARLLDAVPRCHLVHSLALVAQLFPVAPWHAAHAVQRDVLLWECSLQREQHRVAVRAQEARAARKRNDVCVAHSSPVLRLGDTECLRCSAEELAGRGVLDALLGRVGGRAVHQLCHGQPQGLVVLLEHALAAQLHELLARDLEPVLRLLDAQLLRHLCHERPAHLHVLPVALRHLGPHGLCPVLLLGVCRSQEAVDGVVVLQEQRTAARMLDVFGSHLLPFRCLLS